MTDEPTSGVEAVLRRALEPFAEAGDMAQISGRPPGEHVDANAFIRARAALATPTASPATIKYADLVGSEREMRLRSHVRRIMKHHGILNGVLEADLVSMIIAASPSPTPAPETWRGLDDARLKRAIDAFYEPCEGTTIDGVRNAILAWERG